VVQPAALQGAFPRPSARAGADHDGAQLYRVAFFVFLACAALAPLAHLAGIHGVRRTVAFVAPILTSVRSYLVGLAFYVTHFPESAFSGRWTRRLDALGGGSHAIWHGFIVLAIYQHKKGMSSLRAGFV
jgi:adiponectin receptor